MGIGQKIKLARERKNLTQKQLAELIGVTSSAVTNYENDTSHPKEPILHKLMQALDVDANFLFSEYFNKKIAKGIPDDELKFALWGGDAEEITPAQIDEVKKFAQFVKERDKIGG